MSRYSDSETMTIGDLVKTVIAILLLLIGIVGFVSGVFFEYPFSPASTTLGRVVVTASIFTMAIGFVGCMMAFDPYDPRDG